ncbi:MAG: hypothetical protein JNN15_09850 [Blastocatellia bacterium]|nr:hypothetical protein [Blastocatellia bacterium]
MNHTFNLQNRKQLQDHKRERFLAWANTVFARPEAETEAINPRLYELGYISHEQEMVLYRDLNSRDSDVGLALIDWRKAALIDSIAYLRAATKKREHELSLGRSRLDSLKLIAAPSKEESIELIGHLEQLEKELHYLRTIGTKMDGLERIVRFINNESAARISRTSEQMLRLFSQSWRGLVKIKAWTLHFKDGCQMPLLQPYKQPGEPEGFLLPIGVVNRSRAIAISREAAGYMLHMLQVIDLLAVEYREGLLQGKAIIPDQTSSDSWDVPHKLIRAIVELFYFCNFELPFSYSDLAVDPEDPTQIWVYDYDAGHWTVVSEDSTSSRTLKRIGAEAADLLINAGALLKCRRDDDLTAIVDEEISQVSSPGEAHNYKLFMCSGLAEFDLDPAGQRVKFRMAYNSLTSLFNALVDNQPNLTLITNSPLGNCLETLVAMALLDAKAFSIPEKITTPDPLARFQVLSHFWKEIGRRRAIAMLGERYVEQVTGGLASLGEPGPDHPTFLTMRAGTFFTSIKGTVPDLTQQRSAFATLGLTDQIRFLDLSIQTWNLAEEALSRLREVHSQGKLRRIVEGFQPLIQERRENIELRFNSKWLKSSAWNWAFIRASVPVLWDFWTKVVNKEPWETTLLTLPPYQALATLLRLFGDVVRVIVIIELSDAEIVKSMPVEAETAGQAIMQGLEGFLENGERLPPSVAEAINFYYDPEIRFDTWLAFATGFHSFLGNLQKDLQRLDVDRKLHDAIDLLLSKLEILYPIRKTEPVEEEQVVEESISVASLDFDQINNINSLLQFLDTVQEQPSEHLTKFALKLLSLSTRADKKEIVALVSKSLSAINTLLPGEENRSNRGLIFNLLTMAQNFFTFLGQMNQQGYFSEKSLIALRPQMADYFKQLSEIYTSLEQLTEQLPQILPEDRNRLAEYLKSSPQKSSGLPYLLMIVCNKIVLDVGDFEDLPNVQLERAETRVRNYLRAVLGATVDEPSIDTFPIGTGRLIARPGQCIVTTTGVTGLENFEPTWAELYVPSSSTFYAKFLSTKYSLVTKILASEFPQYRVLVKF